MEEVTVEELQAALQTYQESLADLEVIPEAERDTDETQKVAVNRACCLTLARVSAF